ncbi:MAG: FAD-dependent oxidoreductase, partial [Mucispirillum sp.]|nr:FAD-dependent oxidoreductase [Mucispirillum sp.]
HELSDKFLKHAEKFGAIVRQGTCADIINEGEEKTVILDDGRKVKCKAVIIATGSKPKKMNAKNEELYIGKGISFCATCDGGFFRNKEVVVVGGGDSALEEGIFLTKFASKVTIVHRRKEFRAVKIIQKRAAENEKIKFLTPYVVDEVLGNRVIEGVRLKNTETGEYMDYKTDGIFVFIGWDANTDIFKNIIELTDGGFIRAGEDTKTNIAGIFAAGDVRKKGLMQVVTAASDGAAAAKAAEKYISEELNK